MALTREERKLLHQKSKQPTFGTGKPDANTGNEGDISFRKIEGSGTVEYVKQDGSWIAVASSGEMPTVRIVGGSGRGGSSSGISNHGLLTGLSDDDHSQYLLIDGTRAMTGDLTINGGDIIYGNAQNATISVTPTAHNVAGKLLTITSSHTTAGTTNNIAGGSLKFEAGQGKGSGAGGNIVFATANAGSSGSTLNALAVALTISDDLSSTFTGDVSVGDDLFLASSGSIVNWNSGDVTLTHAAGKLTFGGDGAVELDFNNHEMTNVDIDSGAIDGTTIGAASQAAGDFTAIGAVAAGTIVGTTIDATTDFTIDGLVITADTITNDAALTVDAAGDIILDANSGVTKFYLAGDTDDLCTLTVAANGATTIATTDSSGITGHLTLDADGDIILDAAGDDIYFKDAGSERFRMDLSGTPALAVTGAFTIDGSSTIRLDSIGNMDFYVNGREVFKFDTSGHAYFHNFESAFTSGTALFQDYKINNLADKYHFISAQSDFKQCHSMLAEEFVSAGGAFNANYGD
mgnify:CR=1 FL=1